MLGLRGEGMVSRRKLLWGVGLPKGYAFYVNGRQPILILIGWYPIMAYQYVYTYIHKYVCLAGLYLCCFNYKLIRDLLESSMSLGLDSES